MDSATILAHWKAQLGSEEQGNSLKTPVDVALREAVRAAFFLKRRWNPQAKTITAEGIPGLSAMPDLSLGLADELLSLVRAVYEAQFLLLVEEESLAPTDPAPLQEMRAVIVEIKAALSYFLERELVGEEAQRLEKYNALPEHQRDDEASLRLLMGVYLDAATRSRALLESMNDGFDIALLARGKELLILQRQRIEQGAEIPTGKARALYYGLLSLLAQKVRLVRTAARYVFRRHSKIVQEVTSAHQRLRVRKASNTKKKKEKGS